MEDSFPYKNIEHHAKRNGEYSSVKINRNEEWVSTQIGSPQNLGLQNNQNLQPLVFSLEKTAPLFFDKKKRTTPSDLDQNLLRIAKTAPHLGIEKKKRVLSSSVLDGKKHALTLSESFVNLIMVHGQKVKARKIFSQTLKKLAEHLQSKMESQGDKKKEVALFNREKNQSFLVVSDRVEKRNVYHLLQKAINNVKPTLQVRKVRIARSVYQVPFIMKKGRQERNAVRWIIESAKKKSGHSGTAFSECLAQAVLDAFAGQGQAREKRDQLHRTAEANRSYLRYRWW